MAAGNKSSYILLNVSPRVVLMAAQHRYVVNDFQYGIYFICEIRQPS